MSILSWLMGVTASGDVAEAVARQPLQFAAHEQEFRGLSKSGEVQLALIRLYAAVQDGG